MLKIALYLAVSYLFIGVIAFITLRAVQCSVMKRLQQRGWLLLLLPALFLLPLAPYAAIEWRTAHFRASLLPPTQQALKEIAGERERILSFKVLYVGQRQAKVYAVTLRSNPKPLCASALILTFAQTANGWQFNGNYEAVWSDCGSASGNIFPPYPDKSDYKY